jgi:hypothetical protein
LGGSGPLSLEGFWREPTVRELAVEQGLPAPQVLDEMIGAAADLWETDEEFAQFVGGICERRRDLGGGGGSDSRKPSRGSERSPLGR